MANLIFFNNYHCWHRRHFRGIFFASPFFVGKLGRHFVHQQGLGVFSASNPDHRLQSSGTSSTIHSTGNPELQNCWQAMNQDASSLLYLPPYLVAPWPQFLPDLIASFLEYLHSHMHYLQFELASRRQNPQPELDSRLKNHPLPCNHV